MAKYKTKQIKGRETYVHRLVVENAIGRRLLSSEHVHHIDHNKENNVISNLVVTTIKEHKILHARQDVVFDGFNPDVHAYCTSCKSYHTKDLFPKTKNRWKGVHNLCKQCSNLYRQAKGYAINKFSEKRKLQQQVRRALKKEFKS